MADVSPQPFRVGLLGAGVIAQAIAAALSNRQDIILAWAYARDAEKARAALPGVMLLEREEDVLAVDADLVVEATVPEVMRRLVPELLRHRSVLPFTLTPLADAALFDAVTRATEAAGTSLYVPSGAIIGLDGLTAARPILSSVSVRTIKSPQSMGLAADVAGIVFEGSAREAAMRFPRNVNVHAALALAGMGFDATRSLVVAQPGFASMRHEIEVEGQGLRWSIAVESRSLGGVTGAFTPLAAVEAVMRYAGLRRGIVVG
jgi:aspartate dehydrogenase